jgi:hypothetical protein
MHVATQPGVCIHTHALILHIQKLFEFGEVSEERLRLCIMDVSPDEKMRTLLEMKETREDLFGLHLLTLVPLLTRDDSKFKLSLY